MAMMVGGTLATQAVAQNTDAIDQARSIAKSLQQKQANDSNAALDAAGVSIRPSLPRDDGQARTGRSGSRGEARGDSRVQASSAVAQAGAAKPAPAAASGQHNQLQKVNVVQSSDTIEIEISSSEAVTPRVSKLSSPARVVVELPETVVASAQNKIPVGSAGVKGVRIGMDGKTPPTTSIVVDLEKALAYDMNPGADDKLVLTLHTQGEAIGRKPSPKPKTAAKSSRQRAFREGRSREASYRVATEDGCGQPGGGEAGAKSATS